MPPRHGQSQFISPVSGLKAPSEEASSSSSTGDEDEDEDEDEDASDISLDDCEVGMSFTGVAPVADSSVCRCFVRSRRGIESRVSGVASSRASSVSFAGPTGGVRRWKISRQNQ